MRYAIFWLYLLLTFPSWAADPFNLKIASLQTLQKEFNLGTSTSLKALPGKNQLQFLQEHQSPNHIYHIRLQQYYQGFPVFGGYTLLHSPEPFAQVIKHHPSITMTGQLFANIATDLPPVSEFNEKGEAALAQFKRGYATAQIEREQITPMIYIDHHHQAHWAYQVSLFLISASQEPMAPSAILDAHTLQPYLKWNDLRTHTTEAQGMGYSGNLLTGSSQYGLELPKLAIQHDPINATCLMENGHARVVDLKHAESDTFQTVMSFPCPALSTSDTPSLYWTGYNQDGYDKINGAYSPANDALYAAEIVRNIYKDWYHLEPLVTKSGKPMKLIMRVHFGKNYANAYWDGKQMTFGDGNRSTFFPLVSLGISAHEVSHGFTQQHANLFYYGESGAINEAFSDMADKAAEFYAGQKMDWRIGWEVFKPTSSIKTLRYMDTPSQDGHSVDSVEAYRDADKLSFEQSGEGLNVHYGSGVYNRLFYLLATTPNWNIRKAFDVMVYANLDYWTPHTNFKEGGCDVLKATHDLNYSIEDVSDVLLKVGIDPTACG